MPCAQWVHIAARKLPSPAQREVLQRVNKPLFAGLRLVGFPLTWVAYARDRAALPLALRNAHAPLRLHVPLSLAHFAMCAQPLLAFVSRMRLAHACSVRASVVAPSCSPSCDRVQVRPDVQVGLHAAHQP